MNPRGSGILSDISHVAVSPTGDPMVSRYAFKLPPQTLKTFSVEDNDFMLKFESASDSPPPVGDSKFREKQRCGPRPLSWVQSDLRIAVTGTIVSWKPQTMILAEGESFIRRICFQESPVGWCDPTTTTREVTFRRTLHIHVDKVECAKGIPLLPGT